MQMQPRPALELDASADILMALKLCLISKQGIRGVRGIPSSLLLAVIPGQSCAFWLEISKAHTGLVSSVQPILLAYCDLL